MATEFIVIDGQTPGQADVDISLNATVQLTSSVSAATYEWVIVSQPEGSPQVQLDPHEPTNPIFSTYPACAFVPTKEGSYLIRLTLNAGEADESVDTTICAVRELQTGDRIPAPQETTEVNPDEGWAPGAVTKILQRVTRLTDSGIFVAQNASSGDLVPGDVVHMNGMTTLGTGDNVRKVPTVGKAFATNPVLVDGPLGVMVGNAAGASATVEVENLCRVMVMGGISDYALSGGPYDPVGAPVFVGNDGKLSLEAGTVVRQVGDVASVVSPGVYNIAISAGSNSIPRGNAAGDLDGMYPDPTVAKINGTSVPTGGTIGTVLQMTDTDQAQWEPVNLAYADSVTGTLPITRGGTGSPLAPFAQGGVVFAETTTSMNVTASAPAGYFLTSTGSGEPTWTATVSAARGGTGIPGGYTVGAMLYANGASSLTQLAPTASGTRGILQSKGDGAAPVWIPNGSIGYPLISKGPGTDATFEQINLGTSTAITGTLSLAKGGTGGNLSDMDQGGLVYIGAPTYLASGFGPGAEGRIAISAANGGGNYAPSWLPQGNSGQILRSSGANVNPTWGTVPTAAFAQASIPYSALISVSSSQTVTGTYTNTTTSYTPMAQVVRALSIGAAYFDIMPQEDGTEFYNRVTTAANNTSANVYIKATITNTSGFSETYVQRFAMPTAHNNNQITGSITFPHWQFFAPINSTYTVTVWAAVGTAGDSFQASEYRLVVSQG